MKKANLIAAVIGMVFSLVCFVDTFSFKQFKNVPVGPEVFPRILAVGLFICCLALFLLNLRDTEENSQPAPTLSLKDPYILKAIFATLVIVVYALLWEPVGFLFISPFALFVLTYLMGKRDWKMMIVVSILMPIVTWAIFRYLLGITLPMGPLDFLV